MRILLVAGGWSNEREVSLTGAQKIKEAMEKLGYEATLWDLTPDYNHFLKLAKGHDFVFLNLHGLPGEDGSLQALLDHFHIPYQGSGPLGSYLALNKALSKQIFKSHNLLTPPWTLYKTSMSSCSYPGPFPLVIKPNLGGSSIDLTIIQEEKDLKQLSLNPEVEYLIEEYVEGIELTCGVLDKEALPPVLIRPKKSFFFDYKSKYEQNGAEEICPAPIEPELTQKLQETALQVHKLLGLKDYSRTDFIYTKDKKLYILEVNTLPGMTPTSLLPQEALAIGLDFPDLIKKLIELGLKKKN